MNIHILGAGSMGCLWAAHLTLCSIQNSRNKHHLPSLNISFISTRSQLADSIDFKLESNFLTLPEHKSPIAFNIAIKQPKQLDEPIDCLLVCTKSFDSLSALTAIKKCITTNTVIVLFQNGLGSQFDILKRFSSNPIYAAVTTEGANRPKAGVVVHAGKGKTTIGALNDSASSQQNLNTFKSYLKQTNLSSMLSIEFSSDIWQALWQKLVINCAINPFTAILNCCNGEVRKQDLFKHCWPDLKMELLTLLELAGYPSTENQINNLVFDVMGNTHQNISSMLQDIRSGKATEIDHICGFAYRFLEENDIPAPTLKYLYIEVQRKSIN